MEYYSAIKKNEIKSFAGKWMELEDTMLGEISQIQKNLYHIFSVTCRHLKEKVNLKAEEGLVGNRKGTNMWVEGKGVGIMVKEGQADIINA
jgi:hypothetical protein